MTNVEKEIVIFPRPYKPVKLRVTNASSFAECNKILKKEFNKYSDLIPDEDRETINKVLKEDKK